ncbi:MAG TPA: hypothetical protein PLK77_09900, partial [Pyrinomonadaceae bacterium]|nr:hypothetical protein [Pyrinomonadaceae bacterium]
MTREPNTVDAANVSQEGRLAPALMVLLLLSFSALTQTLPDKIRGYKVYKDKVSVNAHTENSDAAVQVGEPEVVDVSLSGITLELPAEFTTSAQSGKVEIVTFDDLKVNGIKAETEE